MTAIASLPRRAVHAIGARATSPLHHTAVAARLGVALGVLFGICAVTGTWSYLVQHQPGWFTAPARPAGLYRVSQGLHVITGFATIPVLLAKLWVVAPRLVEWPVVRSPRHALERLLLLPLVGGGIFLLLSGVANVARWYPWTFFFPQAHRWTAWLAMGGLAVHVGATATITRGALRRRRTAESTSVDPTAAEGSLLADPVPLPTSQRREFLTGVALTSSLLAVGTAGSTVAPLSPLSFLGQRIPDVGPQGIPINKTAAGARLTDRIAAGTWSLRIDGAVPQPVELDLDALAALPQHEATLPIACVEGWSADGRWRGPRLRDLLALAGAADDAVVIVHSAEERGLYRTSFVNHVVARDRDTLLAMQLSGEPLHPDHGWPVRLIGPGRPGVAQTKWIERVEVR